MHLTGMVPLLYCESVEDCLAFYQQALNFIVISQRESDRGLEWVYLMSGNSCLMLFKNSTLQQEPTKTNAPILYFYTDEVDALHQYLKAKGFAPSPLNTTSFGMREFEIIDPHGHRLGIGQKIQDR